MIIERRADWILHTQTLSTLIHCGRKYVSHNVVFRARRRRPMSTSSTTSPNRTLRLARALERGSSLQLLACRAVSLGELSRVDLSRESVNLDDF